MDPLFLWIEQSGLSVWLRESPSLLVFPTVLILHTIGMGFLVGTNAAIDLRIMGFAPGVPILTMQRFFPVMRVGLWVNIVSGVLLLIAYPTKALTNPVFYLKLFLIGAALLDLRFIKRAVFGNPIVAKGPMPHKYKILAAASLFCWAGATIAGRLLAYTYVHLMVGE
jgi:hypothetical protein